jgi:3-oxoacid CoA-transferase A subunit
MIDKRVANLDEALAGLGDGMTIMFGGFGGAGLAIHLIKALAALPAKDLTVISNSVRFLEDFGPALFEDKRIKHAVASAARSRGSVSGISEIQLADGTLTLDVAPQGSFAERIRAGGAGIPAFYTPTSVGTPVAEGKEHREFNGRMCVLETALTSDFTLMRADKADRYGNLYFRGTQGNFGRDMAAASKCTVVEVREIVEGLLPQADIHVPGVFVKRIIQLPDVRDA